MLYKLAKVRNHLLCNTFEFVQFIRLVAMIILGGGANMAARM